MYCNADADADAGADAGPSERKFRCQSANHIKARSRSRLAADSSTL